MCYQFRFIHSRTTYAKTGSLGYISQIMLIQLFHNVFIHGYKINSLPILHFDLVKFDF